MKVLIGCEQFGRLREAMRARGHDAYSCDLEPARDGSAFHIQDDVLSVLGRGWDMAILFPDCTYQTNSAAWAYKDPDFERYPGIGYHQRCKPGTLLGEARREARKASSAFVLKLWRADIERIAIENPPGNLANVIGPVSQILKPAQFGEDASKATGLWLKNLRKLRPTGWVEPRTGGLPLFGGDGGLPRWANQTDNGQNRLSPDPDRAMQRAATYPGIAMAMAEQWG